MFKRNYLILLLLALIFATPGITAYFYFLHPEWLGKTTVNKGELLNPPIFLTKMGEKPKWHLILWQPEQCETNCVQQLDKLSRIRLALGRHLYEVEQWLVIKDQQQLPISLTHALREQDVQVMPLPQQTLDKLAILNDKPIVFIANSTGYLILAYTTMAKPGDIYTDLKQLLKTQKSS